MPATRKRSERASAKPARFNARLSPEQKELFLRAAALQHQSLSAFLINSAERAAEEAIRQHEVMQLSERDSRAVMEALRNPGPVNQHLADAAEWYKALTGER